MSRELPVRAPGYRHGPFCDCRRCRPARPPGPGAVLLQVVAGVAAGHVIAAAIMGPDVVLAFLLVALEVR